jgi:hypothetical protein
VPASGGVSFVVPVKNGARWLGAVLDAVHAEAAAARTRGLGVEVLAVDDGSTDDSPRLLAARAAARELTVVAGPGRGAAAAVNAGLSAARHPLICQIDQDVVLQPGWLARVLAELDADAAVAAVQGHYVADPGATVWARVMGLDLRQRYAAIPGRDVDHVCTGNSVYRAAALAAVGRFDERFGYGYDNDMSYRLTGAGYRLVLCREALSVHHFRPDAWGYLRQQYGQGYGRLDLVAKHPRRVGGDAVSGLAMLLHAPLMALACLVAVAAGRTYALGAAAIIAALALERLVAGVRAWRRFGDPAAFFFVPAHLLRDLAWAAAIAVWSGRRVLWRPRRPSDSMG